MTEEQPWLGLTEAARVTGLDREAIRSRVRRGQVPSRRNNRGELLVQLPADLLAEVDRPATGELTALRAALTDLTAEVADLRAALARAEAEREAARAVAVADVATARAEIEAKDIVIAELRAMLAEARRPWWRRLLTGG